MRPRTNYQPWEGRQQETGLGIERNIILVGAKNTFFPDLTFLYAELEDFLDPFPLEEKNQKTFLVGAKNILLTLRQGNARRSFWVVCQ